jgi:hypothetical protein
LGTAPPFYQGNNDSFYDVVYGRFLPALIHPEPLWEGYAVMEYGNVYIPGSAIEAWEYIYTGMVQDELPEKAKEMLVKKYYGEQPMHHMHFP